MCIRDSSQTMRATNMYSADSRVIGCGSHKSPREVCNEEVDVRHHCHCLVSFGATLVQVAVSLRVDDISIIQVARESLSLADYIRI